MAKKEEPVSLTKADEQGLALLPALADPSTEIEVIEQALGAEGQIGEFDLQRLRVPSGGVLSWQVETLAGTESAKFIEGVVVARKNARAWWAEQYGEGGGNQPPDCSSEDGVTGYGALPAAVRKQGEFATEGDGPFACAKCPNSKFGSAPAKNGVAGRGQACKQVQLLFLMQPNDILPSVIAAPPTSLKRIKQFFIRLTNARIPYWLVKLRFRLVESKNAGGIKYGQIEPYIEGKLEDVVIPKASALGLKILAIRKVVEEQVIGRVQVHRGDVDVAAEE